MKVSLCTFALFALAACAQTAVLPSGERFGEDMEARSAVRFSIVDATPADFFNQTVLVEANVIAVCQQAGCWMQIEDEGKKAMVRWESGCGGQYAFPKDLAGGRVLIQGSFYPKSISEADIEHLQEEAGRNIEIAAEGYEFNASSILVLD